MTSRAIYYDHRIRREGFGIEMRMDAAGMNAATSKVFPAMEAGEPSA
jgi:hypothetical protein